MHCTLVKSTGFPRNFLSPPNNARLSLMISLRRLKLRVASNLSIKSEWCSREKRNESRLLRNYENRDVLMLITEKPRRRVDTPEVGVLREKRAGSGAQKVKTRFSKRARSMRLDDSSRSCTPGASQGQTRSRHRSPRVSGERVRFISRPRLRHCAQQCALICPLRNIVNPKRDDESRRRGERIQKTGSSPSFDSSSFDLAFSMFAEMTKNHPQLRSNFHGKRRRTCRVMKTRSDNSLASGGMTR